MIEVERYKHKQYMEQVLDSEGRPTVAIQIPVMIIGQECDSCADNMATWIVAGPPEFSEMEAPTIQCEDCKEHTMEWIRDYA